MEQFLRVRYAVSMIFIDVFKKAYMFHAKNAKPQYANEIKVQIFKISKNRVNTLKIEQMIKIHRFQSKLTKNF